MKNADIIQIKTMEIAQELFVTRLLYLRGKDTATHLSIERAIRLKEMEALVQ